jgi:hypothetical protein
VAAVADVEKALASFEANIERQTGRSVAAWLELLRKEKLARQGEMFAPKKVSVSVRRAEQFALMQPFTKTRIVAGLIRKCRQSTPRLRTRQVSVRDANADQRVRHSQASLHRSNRRNLIRPPI